MKMNPVRSTRGKSLALMVLAAGLNVRSSHGTVILGSNDVFTPTGTANGDLQMAGNLSVVKGFDLGTSALGGAYPGLQIDYFAGSDKVAKFALVDASGAFQWQDNLGSLGTTAKTKMTLDGANVLSLYNSAGTSASITLQGGTGQIHLAGTGSGIYSGGSAVFSLGAGGEVTYDSGRPVKITNTTASSGTGSGALSVAGGLSVTKDSYINNLRIGTGGGGILSNAAFGMNALAFNTTGVNNTGLGSSALVSNTTGDWNTAVGSQALNANTTGGSNAGFGTSAMHLNTTGSGNAAFGKWSLFSNSTGNQNSAFGTDALRGNTGSENTGVGFQSMYSNTTGIYNVVSGHSALYSNTTGSGNVALGYRAGQYHTFYSALTDPENSIYIGAQARGGSNADNNSIVIGYFAIGEGPNTTVIGNYSTTKTHLYGQTNSDSLKVTGATVLEGSVTIAQPQGDIPMFTN